MRRCASSPLRAKPLAIALAAAFAASAAPSQAADTSLPAADRASARYALRSQLRSRPAPASARTAPSQRGATLPVTSCLDDEEDPGTLRNVLATASEGDTIDLTQLGCSTITLSQGAIDTSVLGDHHLYDITLQGPGRDELTIDADGQSQVFVVGGFSSSLGTFTANDLSIANGTHAGSLAACIEGFGGTVALNRVDVVNCHSSGTYQLVFGGAVDVTTLHMTDSTISASSLTATGAQNTGAGGGAYVGGDAVLVRSTISGNSVVAPMAERNGYITVGGGLYVRGNLGLTDSTIAYNTIEATAPDQLADGGGVFVRGSATITGSTFEHNRAEGEGGGLYKSVFSVYGEPPPPNDTRLTIANSTFYANIVGSLGGGIFSLRPTTIASSTIVSNLDGAGLAMGDTTVSLEIQSSLFSGNLGCFDCGSPPQLTDIMGPDFESTLTVEGMNNLIRAVPPNVTVPADTISDDPNFFYFLWTNGGRTRTLALMAGSPAIDAGNNAGGLATDQRGEGFARVSGAAPDIGAFEVQQPPGAGDTIFRDGFDGAAPTSYEYAWDDGDGDTNQGPPSSFDPDMLWGNYYLAEPGGEIITHLSAAFGPTFPSLADGPVTFWLLGDDDSDFDPRNAHVIASAWGSPSVFNDTFYSVEISPTWVHGGFFVGVSAKLQGGEDRPARVDTDAPGNKSWFFYAPDIAATIDDLANAPFGARMDDTSVVIFPGAFMVRATGESAQ